MLAHLGENLLPFWLEHCVDGQYGGFLTQLSTDGSADGTDKMLVTQAGTIGTLARLWREGYHDPRIREAAAQGMEFLAQNFNDEAQGGWFWQVARDGTAQDMTKKTCGQAAVLAAMAEYHRAFGDRVALRLAELTFDVLERHAKDPANPGYLDAMTREWAPEPGPGGQVKTTATHVALMEAFTSLYLATGNPVHARRAQEVLDLLAGRCCVPEKGYCLDAFHADWRSFEDGPLGEGNRRTSYGLNLQVAWSMQRTVEALGLPPGDYRKAGLALVDHALRNGWDEKAGAICFEGPLEGVATGRTMESWTQAESAIALDWAWRVTEDERYLAALRRQVAWVLERQADPVHGGWYSTLRPDGTVESSAKGHLGHGPCREVRACLNVGLGRWQ
jgi:mannose/cellobiose epimerase-like protein (N-acyl-D-glucosamine 2-epimerase family)